MPNVPVSLWIGPAGTRFTEPGMLTGGMVGHEVKKQFHNWSRKNCADKSGKIHLFATKGWTATCTSLHIFISLAAEKRERVIQR